jgi:hypothetical protein
MKLVTEYIADAKFRAVGGKKMTRNVEGSLRIRLWPRAQKMGVPPPDTRTKAPLAPS